MRFSFVGDFLPPVSAHARRARRRPSPMARLCLEALEDRCLLSGGITLTPR
jgi:hypothetical protein